MKKILFITNIPAPYRIDFYNELGKYVDLTVIFEAKGASNQGIKFNWNIDTIKNFKAIFLSEHDINEKKIDWKMFKYLKKNIYDEIFVTNYSYFTEMAALIYLKLRRIPYYMETDGGMIKYDENKIKKMYKHFLVSGAKGYFSPSKSSDDYLVYYGADRKKIFRYPFTSLKEKDILKEPLSKKEKNNYKKELNIKEKIMILGVGRFIYGKGWDILIDAAKNLDKNIGIYIVGGNMTQEYRNMLSKYNITNVYFEDFKTQEQLKKYYMAADIFVLPTRGDVWGLVINEAMACGLSVITTNKCVAGLELVKNSKNGYIVDIDSAEVQEKIEELIKNEEIINYELYSLYQIKKYTIENMVKSHLEIINQEKVK